MKLPHLSGFFACYVGAWTLTCLSAAYVLIKDRHRLLPEWRQYVSLLGVPRKLSLFAVAFVFVAFAGRLTNDETWDVGTGAGMAILTFVTAPWCVGLLYQVSVGRRGLRYLLVAVALLFFSSSGYYDAYLLLRDGVYTARWLGNLMLSPFIYVAAGLLWNLEAKDSGHVHEAEGHQFSFRREDWPSRPRNTDFAPLIFASLPFILIAAFVLVAFVGWRIGI